MSDRIVVVGGGLAAGTFVTELREGGHDGQVTVVTEEPRRPYERPPLSKGLQLGSSSEGDVYVQSTAWYDEHDVELRTSTSVTAVDLAAQEVTTTSGTLGYDQLVLATGARPRRLALADDSGTPVTYLRTLDDALRLKAALRPGKRIGIVGGGWIGLEIAAAARQNGAEATVVESLAQPLLRVLGEEVAQIFAALHREHDVDLRTGARLGAISPDGERARLELLQDDPVSCDLVLVGVGVQPATELAEAAGLTVEDGIRVDARLRTSDPHVLAIGDVANADHPVLGRPVRVEHWDTAIRHGKVAAHNVLGQDTVHDALPYFFTDQYDLGMEYVGSPGPEGFERVVLRGDVAGRVFTAWWLRGEEVVAGMQVNDWDAIGDVRRIVGARVDPQRLADGSVPLAEVGPEA